MRVVRERPCQRLHHRVVAPIYIELLGRTYRAEDWSLGGFCISGLRDALPEIGSAHPVSVAIPFQGFNVSFEARVEVVRTDLQSKTVAVRFTHLGEREAGLMSHFVDELVRGSMSPLEDTILRIDLPVTPVSTKPDPNPQAEVPLRRWPIKTAMMTLLYIALGAGVLAYLLVVLYSQFFRLEVETAVVTAPIEVVSASGDGRVTTAFAEEGDPVSAGQSVLLVADFALEQEIDAAKVAVDEARARLLFVRRRVDAEKVRLNDYALVAGNEIEQTALTVSAAREQLAAARANAARMEALLAQGWATRAQYEEATSLLAAAEAEFQARQIDHRETRELAERGANVRHFDGDEFQGELEQLEAEEQLARDQLVNAEDALAALYRHRERLAVTSPFDGHVVDLSRSVGSAINRGDVLAVFEKTSARVVEAFLTQEEVLKVGLDDKAVIYLPAIDVRLNATVIGVDRTQGFVDEQGSRYTWRGPKDRSALVTLDVGDLDSAMTDLMAAGMPAVVIFKRRSASEILASVRHRIAAVLG